MSNLFISLLGMVVLLGTAVVFSSNRRAINVRTVAGAFGIQLGLGAIILYVPFGRQALEALSNGVGHLISYGQKGIDFVLGAMVSDKMFEVFGGGGFVFAFRVLPMIVFFSSLIAVLYYLGVMRFVIKILGGFLSKILGTSQAESMSAAANIFVGQTEAPLVVKPFIRHMTRSELFAVMCGGLASIAGSVLVAFSEMGVKMEYLLAASFMAAPGGLLFAKLLLPETEKPREYQAHEFKFSNDEEDAPSNVLDAAANGASTGMQIAMSVGAMLIAIIALVAMIDGFLGWIAGLLNLEGGLSLAIIFGKIFAPVAWVIGVPSQHIELAGSFFGQKLAINEFYAYAQFQPYLQEGAAVVLDEKTKAIISFALCGFANFSSIAILVGGLSIMAPNKRGDVASLGLKALLAGSLSNLMSATIAGLFIALT